MTPNTDTLRSSFTPSLALIVYKGKSSDWMDYYIESHEFDASGRLLEGRPLQSATIAGMVELFRERHVEESQLGGNIPSCLLSYTPDPSGNYQLIWHRPAEQRTLWFSEQLHIASGAAMVPPMLYIATKGSLQVFALDSDKRPGMKTKIYQAPFHNVSAGGVCLGSAKAKKPVTKTFAAIIRYWEAMFWNSEFTHINGDNPVDGNLNLIWAERVANPTQKFPLKVLKQTTVAKSILTLINEAQ